MAKFVFVTGGVLPGLGKGITAASIGNIIKYGGVKVSMMKLDQYLNVDAGTLNPSEHGECFVTDDGAETDLDLGHYERFIDENLTRESSVMSGQIYNSIIENERQGKYLGKTIQLIPHLTDEVKRRIFDLAKKTKAEVVIVEIGGTIGDYEGMHFVEAVRQMRNELPKDDTLLVHVGFLPYLETTAELKTKPLQNSVRDLATFGLAPDVIVCRADHPISEKELLKVSMFSNVAPKMVFPMETVDSVYKVPLILDKYGICEILTEKLNIKLKKNNTWQKFVDKTQSPNKKKIKIALVGKYMTMKDTYLSVVEALKAAAWNQNLELELGWIDSEKIEKVGAEKMLKDFAGIVVPGGFGNRGIEGKILAAKFARENQIPYLGLCLGMQIATIEFAREVLKTKDANSTEFAEKTKNPVIHIMDEQKKITDKGATMRLGAYKCKIKSGTLTAKIYGKSMISERHRHRYEFNNKYRAILGKAGLVFAGENPEKKLVEIIELESHPFFVASQFHPEFKSRPNRPHPLFKSFIEAASKK